ncbi:MAG TPA: preprotein translocase subunit YajC [Dehalococcoidia bacterium]|jgi:preprotein translocase YajC subunit|nr:preprotein translocase subunit YajC [Dehalococcoidia bacterium]
MGDAELISAVVIAIVLFVYMTIIRPAEHEKKQHQREIRDLRPGDQVLTTSNFIGLVKDIQVGEDGQAKISIEIANGVVVTALPNAVLRALSHNPAKAIQPGSEQKGASV